METVVCGGSQIKKRWKDSAMGGRWTGEKELKDACVVRVD